MAERLGELVELDGGHEAVEGNAQDDCSPEESGGSLFGGEVSADDSSCENHAVHAPVCGYPPVHRFEWGL